MNFDMDPIGLVYIGDATTYNISGNSDAISTCDEPYTIVLADDDDTQTKQSHTRGVGVYVRVKSSKAKVVLTVVILLSIITIVQVGYMYFGHSETSATAAKDKIIIDDNSEGFIKISLIGDISLARRINGSLVHNFDKDYNKFVAGWSEYTKNDDITFGNLESPISKHRKLRKGPYSWKFRSNVTDLSLKEPVFCSPPINVNVLTAASVDIVTIVNNHCFDCTQFGILDTITILNNNNIDYVGTGNSFTNNYRLIVKDIKDVKIGFVGYYADASWFDPYNKMKHNKNMTNILKNKNIPSFIDEHLISKYICDNVKYFKKSLNDGGLGIDVLLFYFHWLQEYISDDDINNGSSYAKFHGMVNSLSECGVDIIVGSHPHVLLQPKWINNDKTLVFWSLGNFVFDSSEYVGRTHETCLTQILIDPQSKKLFGVRYMEGEISPEPMWQTILTGQWQMNKFCKQSRGNFKGTN